MPALFAPVFRACCVAGLLMTCSVGAAEKKPSLIGTTREEILARFGEPKSQITVGNRQVLFFAGERIVLRDNRVVEAEEIPIESVPPAAGPKPAGTGATVADGVASEATANQTATASDQSSSQTAATSTPEASIAPAAPSPEPEVVIKSVRPPTANEARTLLPHPEGSGVSAESVSVASSAAAPVSAAKEAIGAKASATAALADSPQALPQTPASATSTTETARGTDSPGLRPLVETAKPAVTSAAHVSNAAPATASSQVDRDTKRTSSDGNLGPILVGAAVAAVVAVVGFLAWRGRRRNKERMAAVASRSPFAPESTTLAPTAHFTLELLNKLEWRRFEQLVVGYYNKTGVVASSTKSAPGSPVNIRISWKGEQRPFACVRCVAHPPGVVEVKPVQELYDVLVAEGIRRAYVVTSGKFSPSAREFAEEKHITLLPGDVFLEKLNTLPDPARAELFKDATAGDYSTPTCARCDTKMGRAPDNPGIWQCPQCGSEMPRT